MKTVVLSILPIFLLTEAFCQWDIPVRIEMNGATDADRQITGLADPLSSDAAVSLDAARATTMAFTEVDGTDLLSGTLSPAPTNYVAGMALTIVPLSANADSAALDLNGLGPIPIVKWGGVPLDSADLRPNVPARLVYDGVRFQLISAAYIACPTGFKAVDQNYCIGEEPLGEGNFFSAAATCRDLGARLCTFSEWLQACSSDPAFIVSVGVMEWVDHAANNESDAKVLGFGSTGTEDGTGPACDLGGTRAPTLIAGIRCCRNR